MSGRDGVLIKLGTPIGEPCQLCKQPVGNEPVWVTYGERRAEQTIYHHVECLMTCTSAAFKTAKLRADSRRQFRELRAGDVPEGWVLLQRV